MNIIELLAIARKVDNYENDPVAGLKVLWTSTTVFQATCPAGKRWFLLGGYIDRDVAATCVVRIRDSAANFLRSLSDAAASTVRIPLIENEFAQTGIFILDPGDYVHVYFGVAQGAAAFASCQVLEVDI
ncbi:unnamed protein product [marine sediment metagenome]|uniref:Uncharacterized protein n=1 Tax=marine sediment metagenome TaxID=412755 RepID=X1QL43_9ZZZZ